MPFDKYDYALAKIGYDAYVKQAGGVSLPEFDTMEQPIRDAWAAAAVAIQEESLD